jgi:hypothetical protein
VSALVASDGVEVRREYINDLAFAFIAPLGPDHNDVFHISQELSPERSGRETGSRGQFHAFLRPRRAAHSNL